MLLKSVHENSSKISTRIHPKTSMKIYPKRWLLVDKSVHKNSPKVFTKIHPFWSTKIYPLCPQEVCQLGNFLYTSNLAVFTRRFSGLNLKKYTYMLTETGKNFRFDPNLDPNLIFYRYISIPQETASAPSSWPYSLYLLKFVFQFFCNSL